jgi:DNA-binding XRE family transcriptional regulator
MNKLKKHREDRLLSKAELARRADLSALTIDRIEKGFICRIDTQRRILAALGLSVDDKNLIFDD